MKMFMIMACLLLVSAVQAETLTDSIHSIVKGEGKNPHLVRFENGRVAFIEQDDVAALQEVQKLLKLKVIAGVDKNNELVSLKSANLASFESDKLLVNEEPQAFEPSVISMGEAQRIYDQMNPNFRRISECTDRAHVWAYDEFVRTGIKAQKAFLFFVNSYIIKYRAKWWFHVAPMYNVQTGGGVQPMVLDFRYVEGPVPAMEWKNRLVHSKRDCVMDFRFVDYDKGADQSQDCYMKYEPMYYRLPGDISAYELNGIDRSSFNDSEVNGARSRAFNSGSI